MSDRCSPLFSVIIPTHNRPTYLVEAIDSVLAQTVQDFEVIVVDDASEPPVPLHEDPRVRVVRRDTAGGPAQARNDGVGRASGEYLAFLDDDDWYEPNRLQVALEGLERAPITLCWGGYSDEEMRPGLMLEGHVHEHLLDNGFAPAAYVTALRRDHFVPFDREFRGCEDIDWWLRLTNSNAVSTVPAYCYLVRRHDEIRGLHGIEARLAGSLMLLEKHRAYFATHPRARSFRWRRIGAYHAQLGHHRQAALALLRALVIRPDLPTSVQLARTLVAQPSATTVDTRPPQGECLDASGRRYYASERLDMLPHVPAVDSYLDLGCGEGRFAGHLKSRRPDAEVWGIEPDADAAAEAATRLDRVITGSFPDCVTEIDRRFACIVCNDVLEHMADPWGACAEIAELLEPGGTLVASIPNIRNLGTLSQVALKGRWDYVPAGVLDRTHLRFFTKATMTEMIERAGLRVQSVSGSWPLTTAKMRVLRAAAWCLSPDLATEGVYRQYVVVAKNETGSGAAPDAPPTASKSGNPGTA